MYRPGGARDARLDAVPTEPKPPADSDLRLSPAELIAEQDQIERVPVLILNRDARGLEGRVGLLHERRPLRRRLGKLLCHLRVALAAEAEDLPDRAAEVAASEPANEGADRKRDPDGLPDGGSRDR